MKFSIKHFLQVALVCFARLRSCQAGLCEYNPSICQLHTGTYTDHDSNTMNWWAFEPIGDYACPAEGCPLYVWIDGTEQAPYQTLPDQLYIMEMLKRGFVAVNVEYDARTGDYTAGCYGSFFNQGGFNEKSQEIFDGGVADSVISQVCDNPGTKLANCDLGIATHGWSQGAHIAGLAGNHEARVSASLLFGNGNDNSIPFSGDISCMTSNQLSLPKERRRSITGESDDYFGEDYSGVLQQQIETSGYDCRRDTSGYVNEDHWNCFNKLPSGCDYAAGEQFCEEYGVYYSLTCPACDILRDDGPCPSNDGLVTNACPSEVPDPYLGGDATIENTAGYYIISGEEYCRFMGCNPSDGAPHGFFQNLDPDSDFMSPDIVWGLEQNLDWLARIARKTASAPNGTPSPTDSPKPSGASSEAPSVSPSISISPTFFPTYPPTPAPEQQCGLKGDYCAQKSDCCANRCRKNTCSK